MKARSCCLMQQVPQLPVATAWSSPCVTPRPPPLHLQWEHGTRGTGSGCRVQGRCRVSGVCLYIADHVLGPRILLSCVNGDYGRYYMPLFLSNASHGMPSLSSLTADIQSHPLQHYMPSLPLHPSHAMPSLSPPDCRHSEPPPATHHALPSTQHTIWNAFPSPLTRASWIMNRCSIKRFTVVVVLST